MSDIGLNLGDSFDFVATLLNVEEAFRSNELHGHAGSVAGHIGFGPFTFDNYNTFSSVPEPTLAVPISLGSCLLFVLATRRWRSRSEDLV